LGPTHHAPHGTTRGAPSSARLRLWLSLIVLVAISAQTGCRAQQTWPLWEQYAQRFVDGQGRVIDRTAQDRTTSEGQAYAMFFALVANDHARFASLLNWTQDNLAGGDLTLHLPAWSWGKSSDGSWRILDPNPATDADLWMAYSLLEAGRLWHEPRFDKLGRLMAARIAREEVVLIPGLGTTLLPGPHGFHPMERIWLLNPSYLPPSILVRFSKATPQGPWSEVLASLGALLASGSGHAAAAPDAGGFAMDWVAAGEGGTHPSATPAQLLAGTKDAVPIGSYDAIRVYLWLGIADPGTPGLRDLLGSVSGMAALLKANPAPPRIVDATGSVVDANGTIGFSAALVPYLDALRMKSKAAEQLDRLTATRDPATGLYGREAAYYDQNLALFATGWAEQRYRFDRDGRLKVKWKSN
jgi:endo-1,4-beta-D-glucanase Y